MSEVRKRLVKLVRDRVGEFVATGEVAFEPLDHYRLLDALDEKLIEEAVEYLKRPSVGELADIYEAVDALSMHRHGVGIQAVAREAEDKRRERGGFDQGIGLFVHGGPPTMRHEGEHPE